MIEDIAIQYASLSQNTLKAINYGLLIGGAVLAALTRTDIFTLLRAPFFAYLGALIMAANVSQTIWLESIPATVGGYLWVFMVTDLIVMIGSGYCFGILTMARSRDAYGHNRNAVLGFIPIANFWLMLTPSKLTADPNRLPTVPLFSGVIGVLLGFVMFGVSGGLLGYISTEQQKRMDETDLNQLLAFMIKTRGLETTIRDVAAEVPPQKLDDSTKLLRAEGHGSVFRYVYEVTPDTVLIPKSMADGVIEQNCSVEFIRNLIDAGATIRHHYQYSNGSVVGTVAVTSESCG